MTVSVVIPAYGAETTLAASVHSALANSPLEVIIVDDGSRDQSGDIADQLARDDQRVRVLHRTESGGPAVARNAGLQAAQGEWVLFLDGDDLLEPTALATLHGAVNSNTVAVLGRFEAIDDLGQPLDIGTWNTVQLRPVVRRSGELIPSPLTGEALLTRLVIPPPSGVLVRRKAAVELNGYDVTLGRSEDLDFLLRLGRLGELTLCDSLVVQYRRTPGQRSQATSARRRGRQRMLLHVIFGAPQRRERWALARGAAAHHLDRADVRWRAGTKSGSDLAATLRSATLALAFRIIGVVAFLRP